MADFKWDPSTLAQLSAPGFNRNIGTGDVVPYWGKEPDQPTVAGASAATPGTTFDPGAGGAASPIPNSFLNYLSSLQPILDQIQQAQQQAAIPSGQGNAQAQPLPAAVPGATGMGPANAGALPLAGAPPVSGGIAPIFGLGMSGQATGDATGGPGPDSSAPGSDASAPGSDASAPGSDASAPGPDSSAPGAPGDGPGPGDAGDGSW